MSETTIAISFESLLESIAQLAHSDKRKLWEYLDSELFDDDDDDFDEMDEQTIADIQVARAEYATGDYLSYDQYLEQRGRSAA